MLHMIDDQIEAYRRAVADTAKARAVFQLNPHSKNNDSLVSCMEEEQLRLDGLKFIIAMAIKEAAAEEPHNPFSINGDVNQPGSFICNNSMMPEPQVRNQPNHSPPPRRDLTNQIITAQNKAKD